MKQEKKELLLKDLCARLPYGVKAYVKNWSKLERKWFEGTDTVKSIYPSLNTIFTTSELGSIEVILGHDDYEIKPYLFPLSSMTEEQNIELSEMLFNLEMEHLQDNETGFTIKGSKVAQSEIDWYNKNHFDYRGLIPMGLANDATGLNIY